MSRLLGDVSTSISQSSISYQAKFLVFKDEIDAFMPEIKSEATWAPEKAVVTSVNKTKNGPHWILDITAEPMQDGQMAFNTDDPNEFVLKEYDTCDFYFHSDFWGARQASSTDAKNGLINVNGEPCKVGDYLFGDATNSSKGAADYTNSPFPDDSPNISVSLIEQSVKTMVYCCTFYSRRNVNYFADFTGVNGSFSVKCRPYITTAGRWKVEVQKLVNSRDKDGKIWARVNRKMILAPEELKWDANKNGGTWKW